MRKVFVIIIIIGLLVLLLVAGCTQTRYVTVPEYHETVVRQSDTLSVRDSVFVHDSTSVTHWGDTVVLSKFHVVYRDRWQYRTKVDSFIQRDTVTVVKEVEKNQTYWQKAKEEIWTLLAAAAAILLLCWTLKRKLQKEYR